MHIFFILICNVTIGRCTVKFIRDSQSIPKPRVEKNDNYADEFSDEEDERTNIDIDDINVVVEQEGNGKRS